MTDRLLVLWDVDHTLVNAGGVGARALLAGLRAVLGREPTAPLPLMAGRTDRWIVSRMLHDNGVSDPEPYLEAIRIAAEQALAESEDLLRTEGRALPGAAGAGVVGVATGRYSTADLRKAGAHTVLADLTDTAAVTTAILAFA
jgi:phosphoglycolate phosphatase